jgi:hypothetical protein
LGGDHSSHPLSLRWQARNHAARFSDIHWGWNFLPWHRAQLLFFEAIVRDLSGMPDFALPYWDPTDQRTRRLERWLFQDPFVVERRPGVMNVDLYAERLVRYAGTATANMDERRFRTFGGMAPGVGRDHQGALERGTHNCIHDQIGTDGWRILPMASPESPFDPIFWLHHCNIDRIWASWQDRHGFNSYNAQVYPPEWQSALYRGHFTSPPLGGAPLDSDNVAVTKLVQLAGLGYAYDELYLAGSFAPSLISGPTQTYTLSSDEISELSFGNPAQRLFTLPRESLLRPIDIRAAYVSIELTGQGLDQYLFRVFLHPRGETIPFKVFTPALAEVIAPRGMRHEHAPHANARTAAYEINVSDALRNAVAQTSAQAGLADVAVSVVAVPAGMALSLERRVALANVSLEITVAQR